MDMWLIYSGASVIARGYGEEELKKMSFLLELRPGRNYSPQPTRDGRGVKVKVHSPTRGECVIVMYTS